MVEQAEQVKDVKAMAQGALAGALADMREISAVKPTPLVSQEMQQQPKVGAKLTQTIESALSADKLAAVKSIGKEALHAPASSARETSAVDRLTERQGQPSHSENGKPKGGMSR